MIRATRLARAAPMGRRLAARAPVVRAAAWIAYWQVGRRRNRRVWWRRCPWRTADLGVEIVQTVASTVGQVGGGLLESEGVRMDLLTTNRLRLLNACGG